MACWWQQARPCPCDGGGQVLLAYVCGMAETAGELVRSMQLGGRGKKERWSGVCRGDDASLFRDMVWLWKDLTWQC